jgi:uncharacterized repeat protein (TIGR01451 family)
MGERNEAMMPRGFSSASADRIRRGLTLSWLVLFVLSILLQYGSLTNPQSTLAVHDEGFFELDGNPTAEAAPGDDWSLLDDGAGDPSNDDSAVASVFITDEVPERSFTGGGSKDDLDMSAGGATDQFWLHAVTPIPDKDDIQHAFAALYGDIIYFGADRFDNDGDAQVGFWFFKNGINVNGNGTFTPPHTVGDLLVLSHFTNGGAVSTIELYEWVGSGGDTNGTLDLVASGQTCTNAPAADKACAIANAVDVASPWPYDAKQPDPDNIFGANAFFEGGLDLSDVFGPDVPCFTGFLVETRSSQSVDATLKDFASGAFNTCASLTIVKDAIPNDAQDFAFSTTGDDLSSFSLDDDADGTLSNTKVFTGLNPGAYSVTEAAVAGWDLTGLTCNDANGSVNLGTRTASVTLDASENVTCTFTNSKRGHIIVDKVTNPSGDPQSFSFDAGGYADFSLTDAAVPNDSGELVAGIYSVSETVPAGWDLTSATCSDGSPVSAIDLAAGETVTCTFTNTKRGTIIVEKQTSPDGAAGSFTFTGTAAGSISDGGTITVPNLAPGTYTSTEADPTPGFDLTSIICNDANSTGDLASRTATFHLDPGETVKCTFTNAQRGTITIIKNAVPDDPQDFVFSATGSGLSGFSLDDDANATLSNTKTFTNVVAGSYSVTEAAVAGWDLSNLACVGVGGSTGTPSGATANITMTAGGSVTCTFTNSKPPSLFIDKSYVGNTGGTASNGLGIAKVGDTLTYTLAYDLSNGPVTNGVITDTLPNGLAYVANSATNNDEFTFVSYDAATRTLTWTAATVTKDGSVSYKVTVLDGSFNLPQPLVNTATIDSDQTAKDDDTASVLVQVVLAVTSPPTLPPTDTIDSGSSEAPSNPGFGLMLALLAIAGIGLLTGYVTPVAARNHRKEVRRR